jgi:hypothetical protein
MVSGTISDIRVEIMVSGNNGVRDNFQHRNKEIMEGNNGVRNNGVRDNFQHQTEENGVRDNFRHQEIMVSGTISDIRVWKKMTCLLGMDG